VSMGELPRVAMVFGSVSRKAGGIFGVGSHLAREVSGHGFPLEVCALEDEFTDADIRAWGSLPVRTFSDAAMGFSWSSGLRRFLLSCSPDILHSHGLWMSTSLAAISSRRKHRIPEVLTPHGMLDPWALRHHAWRKRVAWLAFEGRHVRGVRCLQALNVNEARSYRDLGLKNNICIVPNGVSEPYGDNGDAPWCGQWKNAKVLLFLGRIHQKKGLSPLLEGWRRWQRSGGSDSSCWRLAIVGWGSDREELNLDSQLRDWADSDVQWFGALHGSEKHAAYAGADAFILPSLSEGLPMSVLEAWSHGLPVIMSPACNIPEGFSAQAALPVNPTADSVAATLHLLAEMSDRELRQMGTAGKRLTRERYSWPKIARQLGEVYTWLAGGGAPPGCVI